MDNAQAHPIEDLSPETLQALGARIAASAAWEQHIYREAELDDVWRRIRVELAECGENPAEKAQLQQLLTITVRVHDLVSEARTDAASSAMNEAIAAGAELARIRTKGAAR